jgi:hypothetical protein
LLFVTPTGIGPDKIYTMRWRRSMNLLFVTTLSRSARAINTIAQYSRLANELGHDIAVFGEQRSDFPGIRFSLDVSAFDFAIFVIYTASDFPDLPYLANLLDNTTKSRRVVIDCTGRYNETIRVEHDFNHLEKMDGHQGWEWIEAFQSVADLILQPALTPRRDDVQSFLFHGYETDGVVRRPGSPAEASQNWRLEAKRYSIVYVGHNWQRWSQLRRFLEAIEPIRDRLDPITLFGNEWDHRPDWAVQLGIQGVDVDSEFLDRFNVQSSPPIPYTEFKRVLSEAQFSPIFHRPLFNELGLVTNRTFETFLADTIPLVMLPEPFATSIYGPNVRPLLPESDIAKQLEKIRLDSERYWEAIRLVREHLAAHHSYRRRLTELVTLLESKRN